MTILNHFYTVTSPTDNGKLFLESITVKILTVLKKINK